MVRKETVTLPYSAMKAAIAKVLEKEGYIADVKKKDNELCVSLIYKAGRPAIGGVKRISKPSRRMYMGVRDVRPVKRGYGLLVAWLPASRPSSCASAAKSSSRSGKFQNIYVTTCKTTHSHPSKDRSHG
jgi:small subunit ribosomal protein S8